ncbi:MAG TPA: DUF4350 domain-containing protein, partial [Nitriliruptorales bacterium]|nr:DUF4350 domain-containing protein [Nitriliruptorales bacterium]
MALLVAGVGVLIALVVGPPADGGRPFDPASSAPQGTRALVEVLRGLGGDVRVLTGAPDTDTDVALLLLDRYDDATRDQLAAWVQAGGILVLGEARSSLSPVTAVGASSFDLLGGIDVQPACDSPAVVGVDRVAAPHWQRLSIEQQDAVTCFPLEDAAGMVTVPVGRGEVVVLGMPAVAQNASLAEADNALLLANLLVPRPGTVVAVLGPPPPGTGERDLQQLVPDGARSALVQLAVAFAVLTWWRSRRLGEPVTEPLPTAIAASELVVAVGHLLQRTGRRQAAAEHLRRGLRGELRRTLGLPADVPPEGLVELVAARSDVAVEALR